jgi:hypothetical protein
VQDLGSIGEIIGALAVVFTLVYLSLQTRQARLAAEDTAKYSGLQATYLIVDLYVQARKSILEHKEILAKANSGHELTDVETLALSLVFHDLFYGAAYSYSSAASSGSVHLEAGDIEYFVHLLTEMPCAISEWDRVKHNVEKMGTDFVSRVDAMLVSMPQEGRQTYLGSG